MSRSVHRGRGSPDHPRSQTSRNPESWLNSYVAAPISLNLARAGHAQRPRIAQIRDNLTDRVAAAGHDGWPGEAEGQNISLAGAGGRLARIDRRAHPAPIGPGMPVPARHAGTAAAGRVFATPSPARTV